MKTANAWMNARTCGLLILALLTVCLYFSSASNAAASEVQSIATTLNSANGVGSSIDAGDAMQMTPFKARKPMTPSLSVSGQCDLSGKGCKRLNPASKGSIALNRVN